MSRQTPLNPWRAGKAAGLAFYAAFDEYRASLATEDKLDRPVEPVNPYPMPATRSKNAGRIKWDEGFRAARTAHDASRRNGGKASNWKLGS